MSRIVQIIAGLLCGLLLMEWVFHTKDGGAFPHINAYVADATLGLRLQPGATQKVQLGNNPITSIRINESGYRGENWPSPSSDEIIVVGDSQVFGLGVEEHQRFTKRLAQLSGRQVINAGVPTYGPLEYTAVAEQLIVQRKPKTVVYTINFVNDLFERDKPNPQRHAEWDGWAVRIEMAPTEITPFFGRRWLYQKSHAFYALRRLLFASTPETHVANVGFPSEGTWQDVVAQGREILASEQAQLQERQEKVNNLSAIQQNLENSFAEIDQELREKSEELKGDSQDSRLLLRAATGNPGDIVGENYFEASRDIAVTADLIRKGTEYRQELIAALRSEQDVDIENIERKLLAQEVLRQEEKALMATLLQRVSLTSALTPELERIHTICKKYAVELVVLVLPIDVQVSDTEWAKYQSEPIDMEDSLVLIDDLIQDAKAMGLRTANPLSALRAVQPGAFLDGDIHLTPVGHDAVATVLNETLKQPVSIALPTGGSPDSRRWIPRRYDWLHTPENLVKGSSKANCETVQIGEWLRINCIRDQLVPTAVEVIQGGRGEAMTLVTEDSVSLTIPIFDQEDVLADFYWKHHHQRLSVTWDAGAPVIAFGPREQPGRAVLINAQQDRLCQCYQELTAEQVCSNPGEPLAFETDPVQSSQVTGCTPSCAQLAGGNLEACSATYTDCQQLVDCVEGRFSALPNCPENHVNAGGNGSCLRLCDDEHPCENGDCHPWQGSGVCW